MKLFLKIFLVVFLVDIILGFSLSFYFGHKEPGILIHIIDEIISFPISLWNRLFPKYGIYKNSTNIFWLIVIINTLVQALVVFIIVKSIKRLKT